MVVHESMKENFTNSLFSYTRCFGVFPEVAAPETINIVRHKATTSSSTMYNRAASYATDTSTGTLGNGPTVLYTYCEGTKICYCA